MEDIDAALPFYRDVLKLALVHRETIEEQGVHAALLDVGDGHIEHRGPGRPRDRRGQVPWPSEAPGFTTWPIA